MPPADIQSWVDCKVLGIVDFEMVVETLDHRIGCKCSAIVDYARAVGLSVHLTGSQMVHDKGSGQGQHEIQRLGSGLEEAVCCLPDIGHGMEGMSRCTCLVGETRSQVSMKAEEERKAGKPG